MARRICELCKSTAKLYCESDRASLCWDCDFKVHGANFLVARHSRTLLCRTCQSPTPWSASGARLDTTVSVCQSCVDDGGVGMEETDWGQGKEEVREIRDDICWEDDELSLDEVDEEEDDEDGDDEEDEDEDDDDDSIYSEEDRDNQVVPCSSSPPMPPPPLSTSSSYSGDEYYPMIRQWSASSNGSLPIYARLKRFRDSLTYPQSQQDQVLWSGGSTVNDGERVISG